MNANADLDGVLEHELQRQVGGMRGPSPAVSQSTYDAFASGGRKMTWKYKAVASLVAAGLALAGGAVAAAAATGSSDPSVWGATVTKTVASCKDGLKDGQHGIGHCVSAVAKTHGPAMRAEHSQASAARTDKPHGKPSDVPHGKSSGKPGGGKPSDVKPGPRSRS